MKSWLTKLLQLNLPAEKPWQRLLWNVAGALMGGLLLTFAVLIATAQSLAKVPALMDGRLPAVLWSTLFFALLSLVFGLVMKRLAFGYLLVSAVFLILSLVNHFKVMITAIPLELRDLALATRLGAITTLNAKSLTVSWATVLSAVPPLLWFAFLLVFSKKLFTLDWKKSLYAAGSALGVFLLIFVLLVNVLVFSPMGFPVDQEFLQGAVYEKTFVPLGLWRSIFYQTPTVDSGDSSTMQNVLEGIESQIGTRPPVSSGPEQPVPSTPVEKETVPPNVIVILSESFFDVTRLEGLHFDGDPLAEFHALQEESVSGKFYSRSLGYGTCNIEIEVLTGINSRFLEYGDDPLHWDPEDLALFTPVPEMMRRAGYDTSFLHMFNDSIYNRTQLFSSMGFDAMYFPGDFGAIDKGGAELTEAAYWDYLSQYLDGEFYGDEYMTDLLINLYEQKGEDSPVFLYAASMENHTPHYADKYDSYDYTFTTDLPLSESGLGTLTSFVQGTVNSSRALCRLVDYFRQCDEPTIIVFYGDHRPGLGLDSGGSVYQELGIQEGSLFSAPPEQLAELYSSNYLIWANDPALLPAEAGSTEAHTSPVYLGLTAMQCAGVDLTRWWMMVDEMRSLFTAYNEFYFVAPDGNTFSSVPETTDTGLFTNVTYVLSDAKNEKHITDRLNELPES